MERSVWKIKKYNELSASELYSILKVRQEVFIVEQTCYYLDADGYDELAVHIWCETEGSISAYCRIFDSGIKFTEASLGRVLTHPHYRNRNLGKALVKIALSAIETRFTAPGVRISAQDYLLRFYNDFGFQDTGKKYLEDGIPHTEMYKAASS